MPRARRAGHACQRIRVRSPALAARRSHLGGDPLRRQQRVRRDVGLETEYGLTRALSDERRYQTFDDGDPEAKFDSPTYRGGFRWRPGRRTDIALTYGKSDDRFSPAATLRYQITEFALHGALSESLSTSQQRLFENVS